MKSKFDNITAMVNKKVVLLLLIITLLAVAVGMGVWVGGKGGKKAQNEVKVTQQEQPEKAGKAFDDLIAQAEEVTIPEIDTSDWQTITSESLGIEFMLPNNWKINERISDENSLCLSTVDEKYTKIESSGSCSIHFLNLSSYGEKNAVNEVLSWKKKSEYEIRFFKTNSANLSDRIIIIEQVSMTQDLLKFGDHLMYITIWNEDKQIPEILNVYHGVLQTLKPIE